MKNFCENRVHWKQGKKILDLYDSVVKPTFFNCPQEHEHVVGCILKNSQIQWNDFINFLKENHAI